MVCAHRYIDFQWNTIVSFSKKKQKTKQTNKKKLTSSQIHVIFLWNGSGWDKKNEHDGSMQRPWQKSSRSKLQHETKEVHINKTMWHMDAVWSVVMTEARVYIGNDHCCEVSIILVWEKQRKAKKKLNETYLSWQWQTWQSSVQWFVFLRRQRSSSSLSCCPVPQRGRSRGPRSSP